MTYRAPSKATTRDHPGATALMLLTNVYDPDPRVRQEALALIGIGCRVRILAWDRDCGSAAPTFECMEGVEVERVFLQSTHGRGTMQLFFYAALYLKMLWRGWRTRFDVVHCHDLDTLPLGFILGKLKGKAIVYDAHESFPDMIGGNVHGIVRRGLVRLENFLIRRTDLLITVGDKLRRHFADRGSPHSVVVGNWKRLSEYSRPEEERIAIRRKLGIPDGALTVAFIAQLHKERQLEPLLDAIDACPEVYLIVGGKGALADLVVRRAATNKRIVYVGFVRGADVPAYTCAADAIYYGFDCENPNARFSAPNKLFEALAAGRPLLTGDFGEIADVVRQVSCGFVLSEYTAAEIGGALVRLRDDQQLRHSMAANAKRHGEAVMNWDRAEETLYAEYSSLIPNAGLKSRAYRDTALVPAAQDLGAAQ